MMDIDLTWLNISKETQTKRHVSVTLTALNTNMFAAKLTFCDSNILPIKA